MSSQTELQKTLQSVMDAQILMRQFYRNVSDLFRTLVQVLEEADVPYELLHQDGRVWTGELTPQLRTWPRWGSLHFGVGYVPINPEESDAILLVNISIDPQFASEPEIWFGVVQDIETHESFPYEYALKTIYDMDFTPDDEWKEPKTWYEEDLEDTELQAHLSFLRIPLFHLDSRSSLEHFVSQTILPRLLGT